jgi:uncharacterized protein
MPGRWLDGARRSDWPTARSDCLGIRRVLRRHKLLAFIGLAAALEAGVFLAQLGREATPFALVLIPALAALMITGVIDGVAGIRRLVGRVGRWRVSARWYLAALGIPLAGYVTVAIAGVLLGEFRLELLTDSLTISALFIPLVVFLPGMLEEFGWRGFGAQTAIEQRHSPAWAVIVVGGAHMLVHLPLYLPGHLYDGSPLWPLPFMLLGYGVLQTWIYLRTGGSVLLAGLMHAALNAWVPLTWGLDPDWAWQARGVVFAVIALLVVMLSGWGWWRGALPAAASTQPAAVPTA